MKKACIIILSVLLAAGLGAEGALKYQHTSTGTTITFPQGWRVTTSDKQILGVSPDKTISVVLQGLGNIDINTASQQLKQWVGASYQNLKTANAGWDTLNGMKIYFFRYQAEYNGTALEGMAVIAEAPAGLAFLLTSSLSTQAASHRDTVKEIFRSFQKI